MFVYNKECNFSQTDSDDPLLFISKHILKHADTDAGTKEAIKTLEVWIHNLSMLLYACGLHTNT